MRNCWGTNADHAKDGLKTDLWEPMFICQSRTFCKEFYSCCSDPGSRYSDHRSSQFPHRLWASLESNFSQEKLFYHFSTLQFT